MFLLAMCLLLFTPSQAVVRADGNPDIIIVKRKSGQHTEYNIPTYLPEVWYDEDAWTLLVQGHNYYTYFDYYILDADGDCQLSGGIGGGTELIDLPALDPGLCTLRLVAPGGDTYEGTFTVH